MKSNLVKLDYNFKGHICILRMWPFLSLSFFLSLFLLIQSNIFTFSSNSLNSILSSLGKGPLLSEIIIISFIFNHKKTRNLLGYGPEQNDPVTRGPKPVGYSDYSDYSVVFLRTLSIPIVRDYYTYILQEIKEKIHLFLVVPTSHQIY